MHLLAIILSVLTSLCFWFWANQPIWMKGPYEVAQFYHVQPESKQVTSFVKASGKWQLESRDSISGEVLRTVEVSLPEGFTPLQCFPNAGAHRVEHALVVIEGRYNSGSPLATGAGVVVADASTGKLLTPRPFEVRVRTTPVCFGARAVIPVMDAALFFEYGKEPVRDQTIKNSPAMLLLDDNEHLLVTYGDYLQIVPWSTRQLKSVGAHEQMLNSIIRLTQLPDQNLLVSSYEFEGGIKIKVELWRWNGTTLERLGHSLVLTPPENSTTKYAAISQAETTIDGRGHIHLFTFATSSWPVPFRSWLTWCSAQGWNVSKFIPYSTYLVKHVLNVKLEVVGQYEEVATAERAVNSGIAIRYQRAEPRAGSYTIKALRTLPQWPNALALGMIVYLLWYVYHRLRVENAGRSTG